MFILCYGEEDVAFIEKLTLQMIPRHESIESNKGNGWPILEKGGQEDEAG